MKKLVYALAEIFYNGCYRTTAVGYFVGAVLSALIYRFAVLPFVGEFWEHWFIAVAFIFILTVIICGTALYIMNRNDSEGP